MRGAQNAGAGTAIGLSSAIGGFWAVPTFGLSLLFPAITSGLIINRSIKKDNDGYLFKINKSKGSVICLESELKSYETNGRFNSLTNELREERNKYEQEYQAQIISPIKVGECSCSLCY